MALHKLRHWTANRLKRNCTASSEKLNCPTNSRVGVIISIKARGCCSCISVTTFVCNTISFSNFSVKSVDDDDEDDDMTPEDKVDVVVDEVVVETPASMTSGPDEAAWSSSICRFRI